MDSIISENTDCLFEKHTYLREHLTNEYDLYGFTKEQMDKLITIFSYNQSTSKQNKIISNKELLNMLSGSLLGAPCVFNNINKTWCYKYGIHFDTDDGSFIWGTPQFPDVNYIVLLAKKVQDFIPMEKWKIDFYRLLDLGRHFEVLTEYRPLVCAKHLASVNHEVLGCENKTIDWDFKFQDNQRVLIEVKSRVGDLINIDPYKIPDTNPYKLFKNVIDKFNVESPQQILQGVWIENGIKVKKETLDNYYSTIDQSKMHFVILYSGNIKQNEAYLLSRSDLDKENILGKFGLVYSESIVFDSDI